MTVGAWQTVVVALVLAVVSAAASMVYANRVAHESERQWCGVVTALDDAYRQEPPQTPTGREIADSIAELRREFGC